jgi:galactonate dehydratase
MTAISGVEIALWDIIGKACGQPVYRLLGGRCQRRIPAYANGWYGGARNPKEYAELAREAVKRGYQALKFDPFGTAWKDLDEAEADLAEEMVAAVREAVGARIGLMIEYHGRLSVGSAVTMIHRLERYTPTWSEELSRGKHRPVKEVKNRCPALLRLESACTRWRILSPGQPGACDVVQMDIAHCGGLTISKKIAAMAARPAWRHTVRLVRLPERSPFRVSTPNFMIQEALASLTFPAERSGLKWNRFEGEFFVSEQPGLGVD